MPKAAFGPDATFALDLRDDAAAGALMAAHGLEPRKFLCAVPRLRWTPYWETFPETNRPNPERSAVTDIGLDEWVFEIDDSTGRQIADRVIGIQRNLPAARTLAEKARAFAQERMAAMVAEIG